MIAPRFWFCHLRKTATATFLGLALTLFALQVGNAQEGAPAEAPADDSVSQLSEEQLAQAEKLFQGAHKAFLANDYAQAKEMVTQLNAITPDNSSVMNLLGAIHTKEGNYEGAVQAFSKAAELAPKDFRPRFNIAEVEFLQKNYPEARTKFQKLVDEDDTNELAAYKVFLTYLLEGNSAMAKQKLSGFNEFSDWPTYYFSQAAQSFQDGNTEEAQDWIISARKIYPGGRNALYAETMLDLGWITQEQFDRIKVTAREAVIDFQKPLRVPKEIAKDLGMIKKQQQAGPRKIKDPTAVKSKPFEAEKANINAPVE